MADPGSLAPRLSRGAVAASRLPLVTRLAAGWALGPAAEPWAPAVASAPDDLLTAPGLPPESGDPASLPPLQDFRRRNPGPVSWSREVQSGGSRGARARVVRLLVDARLAQVGREADRMAGRRPRAVTTTADPTELTAALRAEAARVGLSAIGIAAYDDRWQFDDGRDRVCGDRMVVAVLEQDVDRMQDAPDREYQLTVRRTHVRVLDGLNRLARLLHQRGHRALVYDDEGGAMTLPYAIAAGLGQLGMNGQVLTPQAGSRTRMFLMSTDAPLTVDEPVDFGIPGICERCGICARRCPAGAIPVPVRPHRGVMKWKTRPERCLPMVTLADGCSVCVKTCPVQRFGLDEVLEHYRRTGTIRGQGTDDLEGYRWPLDGLRYGAGERPRVPAEVRQPPAMGRFEPA